VQIDLDITDLSIADILRNINRTLPVNSRIRNSIASGLYAVVIMCKSELLDPLNGMLIIVTNNDEAISVVSKDYIVLTLPEERLSTEASIKTLVDDITEYLIKEYRFILSDFNSYYCKYIYSPEFDLLPVES
jgi:hypothetical protein